MSDTIQSWADTAASIGSAASSLGININWNPFDSPIWDTNTPTSTPPTAGAPSSGGTVPSKLIFGFTPTEAVLGGLAIGGLIWALTKKTRR